MTSGGLTCLRFVALILCLLVVAAACDWTMLGFDAGGTGFNPESGGATSIGTVGHLSRSWTADIDASNGNVLTPVVANGVTYVVGTNTLYAFSATGNGCHGSVPKRCDPLWTGPVAGSPVGIAVAQGKVFVSMSGGSNDWIAFDAAGVQGCLGSPKLCSPVLAGASPYLGSSAAPVVAGGVLYLAAINGPGYAYSATGTTNCAAGTPVVCQPLWATGTTVGGSGDLTQHAAVAGSTVYFGRDKLYAFDATGTQKCSGAPKTCAPLWTSGTAIPDASAPAVASGRVFVTSPQLGRVYAFDAAGSENCLFTPKTCTPLWRSTDQVAVGSPPSVVDGKVVLVNGSGPTMYAFDATGASCSGAPVTCSVAWSAPNFGAANAPSIANGVVYNAFGSSLAAVDAAASANCSGIPKTCAPTWSTALAGTPGPIAVSGDRVFATVTDPSPPYAKIYSFAQCPASPNGGLAPCDIQNAYRLPSDIAGTGERVALVDAFDDPNAEADLGVYRSTFGLPPCTTSNGCFQKVSQTGSTTTLPAPDGHWSQEISLDLDMVSAACPHCQILLVEAKTASDADLAAAQDRAAILNADVISDSFSIQDTVSREGTYGSHYVHPNTVTVASSGDSGYAAGAQFPAALPNVVAVGGTSLSPSGSARGGWSEQVWNDLAGTPPGGGGSGCGVAAKPAWQHDTWCLNRTIADVAAVAKNIAIYDTYPVVGSQPGWQKVGGTSASAPIIAGVYALGGATSTGPSFAPRNVYPDYFGSSFFDIVQGNNGACAGTNVCNAVAGYDGPTGVGTPCGTSSFDSSFSPGEATACTAPASSAGVVAAPQLAGNGRSYVPACPPADASHARCGVLIEQP